MTHYVPILKGRAGELEALRLVQIATRQVMTPLIEVAPKDESDDEPAVLRICHQTVDRIGRVYPDLVMLDGGHFDLNVPIHDDRGVVAVLADRARAAGLAAKPVLRVGDPARAYAEALEAVELDGLGLAVRLTGEDLDEDPDELGDMLQTLLDACRVGRKDADLLLDLGPVDGDVAVVAYARLLRSVIRDLPQVDAWRTLTVAAGAFPVDLSQFTPGHIGERPRYDAQMFDQVRRRRLPRQPDYGDFAVAHPALALGSGFSPQPQLRYTAADHWLVLKGKRNDPAGHAQFHDICRRIAAHPEFAGTPVGDADNRIAAGSPQGPGNGTTWRAVGTTHHLDYVALRLTTLDEP